ncbi:MAG: RluA family pseudouridine synthase [Pseudomonadota bacterium]|nr:MAG: RluA family pseudouridine synthase [Pseudomonadota bacterium]
MAADRVERRAVIACESAGGRLDAALAELWPEFSRSRIAGWIRDGAIRLDGRSIKPRHRLEGGERVTLSAELQPHDQTRPEAIALSVLHSDPAFLVIDKPPGLVVHPGSGNRSGTLVNALLHHDPALAPLPRAGLVHRLDKDTSGCLLVARTTASHAALVAALKRREISRRYQALVWGDLIAGGTVDAPLGRHPVDRRRQIVRLDGRPARSHYRIARKLAGATLLEVMLETGRTHQIRVHMAHIRHPIVGDPVYGRRGAPAGLTPSQRMLWQAFPRQALHARELAFPHPTDGRPVAVRAPLPEDLARLLAGLSHEAPAHDAS